MNTYLLPLCANNEPPYIISTRATDFKDAETKFVKRLADSWDDVDYGSSIEEAREALDGYLLIGEIYDIEEF